MTLDTHVASRDCESVPSQIGKIVAVFLVVGIGLAGATLLFLLATGFFDASEAEDLEALGEQFLGGIAIATVLVFALLVGVVLAALGGMYAAHSARSREGATAAGMVGGAVGHVVMVAALGAILVFGIEALDSSADEPTPTPTPVETQSPEEIASCRELFGQDSPVCIDPAAQAEEETEEDGSLSFDDVWRIGLGLLPAGVVGGLTGTILFRRRVAQESARLE